MKVLLDEDLPHKLRLNIPIHDVSTVGYLGWAGLKNGELLRATEDAGFDVFITGDKKITYQQNLAGRKIAIIQLSAQEWPIIKEHLSVILTAIDNAQAGSFQSVDCGTFER